MPDSAKPRILDLFCCQGGAAEGYRRAGFDVVGVDLEPQPRYPFEFIQGDALEYAIRHGAEFDAIHASPPSQRFSAYRTRDPSKVGNTSPDLIRPTRDARRDLRAPWGNDNVPCAFARTTD